MNTTSSLSHAASRGEIAAHFAGRASPKREAAMRAHVLGCDDCRHHYHRHLILAQLDPTALPRQVRIARGLGLSADSGRPRRRLIWSLALVLVPAAAALLLFARPRNVGPAVPGVGGDLTFVPRGGDTARGGPGLWIYRIGGDGRPRVAGGTVGATDELAFAYTNPSGKPFLMIFGVDRHRHVHWFHPAWVVGQPAPGAVRAKAGPGPHELPEAMRHQFDAGDLIVHSLFAERALDVDTVEARLRAAPAWDAAPTGDDFTVVTHPMRVLP